jgi:hypothetical protein
VGCQVRIVELEGADEVRDGSQYDHQVGHHCCLRS